MQMSVANNFNWKIFNFSPPLLVPLAPGHGAPTPSNAKAKKQRERERESKSWGSSPTLLLSFSAKRTLRQTHIRRSAKAD